MDENNTRKNSTRDALHSYLNRQLKKEQNALKPKRRNERPEKQVEKECVTLMRSWGWKVEIYESKATFNHKTQRWTSSAMKAGTCDCQGTMPNGRSVAVEFKAPGKLCTFTVPKNYRQQEFILEKISMNAFACVTDSAERLEAIHKHWLTRLVGGDKSAQNYLLDMLPKRSSHKTPQTPK